MISELREKAAEHDIHTVEVGAPDTQGRLRGKRVPVDRFFTSVAESGVSIADAMFVFDMQDDLPDNEFVNMDTGYLDCRLVPDLQSMRILTYRPGYALVFADAFDPNNEPHPLAPRSVLANQIERCREQGLDPLVATEMEFYLCTPDWEPVQNHIQYSSLTDALELEEVLRDMRHAIAGAGIEVESSNAEYGPGQIELNTGPADAMTAADNTVLYKSIIKQVAVQHGLRATFMPKPWTEASGSGMHVHTSLNVDGANAFADSDEEPNELMSKWLAGLLEHTLPLTLLGSPTSNGPKRIRPYTFAPTHVHWGLDNRTVLARCITESGSSANRVEFRPAGADANPYLIIAGVLAAGADGVERSLVPPPMSQGDMYTNPGDCTPLPTDLSGAVAAYESSTLAQQLGDMFSRSYASIAAAEVALEAENSESDDPDHVSQWERDRFIEHC
ncbi:MAG: glutamine synthetase family protein [Acidimicrobiaceae bacterium]|nr:glutamine synthetase family protein [Acidimicrobiaceae bacterium]